MDFAILLLLLHKHTCRYRKIGVLGLLWWQRNHHFELKEALIDVIAHGLFELRNFYNREIMRGRYQEWCIWLHFTSRAELRLLIKFYQSEKCKFEERSIFGQAKIGRKNCFHWQDGLHRISYNNIYLSHGWNRIEKSVFWHGVRSFYRTGSFKKLFRTAVFYKISFLCGHCHYVLRNEKSKKHNSPAFQKRSRSLPDKRSGNKKTRRLDLDPGEHPTKESGKEYE